MEETMRKTKKKERTKYAKKEFDGQKRRNKKRKEN